MENGFEKTFITSNEAEQCADEFLEMISQEIEDDEEKTTMLDLQKYKQNLQIQK